MDTKLRIPSFASGLNQSISESLLKPYEAVNAKNCDISNGSLKTFPTPQDRYTYDLNIHTLSAFYNDSTSTLLIGKSTSLMKSDGTSIYTINGSRLDSINFQYNGTKISVFSSTNDTPFLYDGSTARKLKNRRKAFKDDGSDDGFYDANGTHHTTESTITTYAPKGDYIELHYDRIWVSGDSTNPDRLYFSTANVNGADIEDWTAPTIEGEANQHGGFIDVRSYDGSKIIGMKVIFNNIVVFKNKSAYKVFGNSPSNYSLVQLFSSNGAIADKSIVVGNNGAYFLNSDGIYYYDGTNTTCISDKIKNIINSMNDSYAKYAVGYYFNNKYYLAIPTGTSTVNDTLIEYNPKTNSFMTFDVSNVQSFLEYNNELLYSSSTKVKALFSGTTALPLIWESPSIDFGEKNSRKISSYIYFKASGSGTIRFTLTTERGVKTLDVVLTSTPTIYRKKLKNRGRSMKIKVENVSNSSFELVSPEIIVESDPD